MIRNSFLFLDRFGAKKESNVWQQGVHDWNTFLDTKIIKGLSTTTKEKHDISIKEAKKQLFLEQYDYFIKRMPHSQQWRLYELLRDECVYLDIETSGYYGDITVIGLYDGDKTKMMVKGSNLDKETFSRAIAPYKAVVTFNGSSFDLPVIQKYFQCTLPPVHIDLRHVCSKLGYVGGLKSIEEQMNIKRRDEVTGIGGSDAVYLWQMWQSTKNKDYLQKLLWYNEEDIINLKPLADTMIKRLWDKTFKKDKFRKKVL